MTELLQQAERTPRALTLRLLESTNPGAIALHPTLELTSSTVSALSAAPIALPERIVRLQCGTFGRHHAPGAVARQVKKRAGGTLKELVDLHLPSTFLELRR